MNDRIPLKQWNEATNEQRSKWLAEGVLIRDEDIAELQLQIQVFRVSGCYVRESRKGGKEVVIEGPTGRWDIHQCSGPHCKECGEDPREVGYP